MFSLERDNLIITSFKAWVVCALISVTFLAATALADDWPTHRHDNSRSGFTNEQLNLPLIEAWVYDCIRGPRPAWDETPALQDFWQGTYGHKSRLPIENAFRVAVSGDYLYFGSSNTGKVTCLRVQDGSEVWKFFADGPVRFAPTVYQGKVYFGSDDGFVYCLDALSGSLVWEHNASGSEELMFINGRMVSVCPVRTNVLVDGGTAYWGVGLFSGAQTGLVRYLCARDADDGSAVWRISPGKPCQGYLLASVDNLYVPAGKSTPTFYRRSDGAYRGSIGSSRQGGAYALLSNDNKFYFGPHYSGSGSYINRYNATTGGLESVAWGPGNYLVVTDDYSYYSTDTSLIKINRSNQQIEWSVASAYPYELILAGDTLFTGSDDEVAALSTEDGSVIWTGAVDGRVRGLAAAEGKLYVSTDKGSIHTFGRNPADFDGNGLVGVEDLLILALEWLECTNPNDDSCHDEN
jgi:outer membrane protein assembly factor BamB